MAFHIIDEVKKRPRSEWQKLVKERWTRTRIWIQENGEAAFCLALGLGFFVAILHKLVIGLIAFGVIVGCAIYLIAPEGDAVSVKSDTVNGKSGPAENVSSEPEEQEAGESSKSEEGDADASSENVESPNIH